MECVCGANALTEKTQLMAQRRPPAAGICAQLHCFIKKTDDETAVEDTSTVKLAQETTIYLLVYVTHIEHWALEIFLLLTLYRKTENLLP